MKKTLILLSAVCLFSCQKGNEFPKTETITRDGKWGLTIGTSPEDVYRQLQALDKEKNFLQVAVVSRKPYSSLQEIEHLLTFYNAITLEKNTAVVDRVVFQFPGDTVNSISTGGGMLDEISKWPQDAPDNIAIHKNDLAGQLYPGLKAIVQLPGYGDYKITLPDKPLTKPFDPDMTNYTEWGFGMTETVRPHITGMYNVRLFFKDSRLNKIYYDYSESKFYD